MFARKFGYYTGTFLLIDDYSVVRFKAFSILDEVWNLPSIGSGERLDFDFI